MIDQEAIAQAQKELDTASYLDQVQTDFDRLCGALLKVQQGDPGTAENLKRATIALLNKLHGDVEGI